MDQRWYFLFLELYSVTLALPPPPPPHPQLCWTDSISHTPTPGQRATSRAHRAKEGLVGTVANRGNIQRAGKLHLNNKREFKGPGNDQSTFSWPAAPAVSCAGFHRRWRFRSWIDAVHL